MTVQKFLCLKPLSITQFPSLWLKNKCWNSVWKTSCASRIIVSHLAKRNTFIHQEFVFSISQNFGKEIEYPCIYTVFKQWFGLFALELPASQENSLILDDLPTVGKQHEREAAVVQCEEKGNQGARLRNKKAKGWNLERGRSEETGKEQRDRDYFFHGDFCLLLPW